MQVKQTFPCADCGTVVRRKLHFKAPKVCVECGIKRTQRAALEMHLKAGAAYDRFKQSAGPMGRPRRNAQKE